MADEQVEDIVKCPECNSRNLDRDETRGEIVCQDCGLVLEDNVICLLYTSDAADE